ncbi:hypothetical protein Pmani_013476 [Petrolisthes manimaculis]|uniref:Sulfatase N-terminal domain-containing protein n=1 Tax=Petrolisthes manimaculis TaxID=1843537 RepID=A0AAE1UDL8_9EUCA|nr:hypothetical protein Pmani_013476 [Petrolisthes manimaculis]
MNRWHLGFCDWSYTPNHRGFHTFYGFYQGNQDHYTHIAGDGYDFHDGDAVAWEANGNYSSIIYADRAVEIIQEQQNKQSPFFLYIAFQNVHDPLQVPQEYLDLYPGEVDPDRRALLGMVSAMDDAVGRVVETLRSTGLADNTLIVFSSDNGGTSPGVNLPLRGYKGSLWEGGTRVPALIHGSMLSNTPRLHSQLFHVTDWHATLLEAAEAPPLVNKNDGFSQWEALRSGQTLSPRESHIYNLNSPAQEEMVGAIR